MRKKIFIVSVIILVALGVWFLSTGKMGVRTAHLLRKAGSALNVSRLFEKPRPVQQENLVVHPPEHRVSQPQKTVAAAQKDNSTQHTPAVNSSPANQSPVQPEAQEATETPESSKPVSAVVKVKGQSYNMQPDGIGLYPRIEVNPKAKIEVRLTVAPGEPVGIMPVDGGYFDSKKQSSQVADSSGHVDFNFQVRKEPGSYRVMVCTRETRQFLDFWVQSESPKAGNKP